METLLAKSDGELLSEHTNRALDAAKMLIASLPVSDDERRGIARDVFLSVALHDLGKAASGFQKVLRGEQKSWSGKRHEILSAMLAAAQPCSNEAVVFAILTHHQDIPSDGLGDGKSRPKCLPREQIPLHEMLTPVCQQMVDEWYANVTQCRETEAIIEASTRELLPDTPITLTLNPELIASAWLDRSHGKYGQRSEIPFDRRLRASLIRGLTMAADHLGSAHLLPPHIPTLSNFNVTAFELRPFQQRLSTAEGSKLLRAPTGSGKTEAALLWAQRNQPRNGRLFYVLPYTASINMMYSRLTRLFDKEHVGLLHGRATAALYDMFGDGDSDGGDVTSKIARQNHARMKARLAREVWFPIRVCTPHQILRHTLRGKGWETMLADFNNACFIFDEVHAYDPKILGLILGTAKLVSAWGARCLFLSATFPDFIVNLTREVLGPLEIIVPDAQKKRDREILDRKRHRIEFESGSMMHNVAMIEEATRSYPSVLVVCNHVRTAQEVFHALAVEDKVLLHGTFAQRDRNRIEKAITAKQLPRVLVATQVVEVSLDVDFHCAFTEPAPIDALIQRMGRVNRAGMQHPTPIVIFEKQTQTHPLYNSALVTRSIDALSALANPISEGDLVTAGNAVYGGGYGDAEMRSFRQGLTHPYIAQFERDLVAGTHQDWVDQLIEQTDGIVEVLPASLRNEYDDRMHEGLWVEANSLLVPLRVYSLNSIRSKLDTRDDPWVIHCPYSAVTGLQRCY
jgi:CRISPR-associated endonuclease/helicase Cas3